VLKKQSGTNACKPGKYGKGERALNPEEEGRYGRKERVSWGGRQAWHELRGGQRPFLSNPQSRIWRRE